MSQRLNTLYFQDPCTPIMESLIDLHTFIMFYVVGIVVLVSMALFLTVYEFAYDRSETRLVDHFLVSHVVHCTWLELFWTLAPVGVLLSIALPSFGLLYAMEEKFDYNLTVKAVGHQWYWEYQVVVSDEDLSQPVKKVNFDAYMKADDDLSLGDFRLLEVDRKLVLPTQTPIRVLTTSADVIHSWALPSAGVKMDAIPGRLNQVNLYFNRTGVFYGQCSELCGVNHGFMPICVKIIEPNTFYGNSQPVDSQA